MKKTIIGLLSVSCSLMGVWAFCAVGKPAQDAAVLDKAQPYPISFDTPSYHVTASFPIASRKIDQQNPNDRLYVAQGVANGDSPGAMPLAETFSLLYQEKASFANAKDLKAADLIQQFESILKSNEGVTVKELSVSHPGSQSGFDDHYALLEVVDHGRTDYYMMRFVVTDSGVVIGVHTLQKGDKAVDFSVGPLWAFVDSIAFEKAHKSP